MTTLTAKDSAFEELPDDIYAAQLTAFEEIKEGEYGPRIKLVWSLDDMENEDGSPRDKWQWVSQKLTPKSTLWAVSKALGVTPDLGNNYELDEYMNGLVGRRAQLVVKTVDGPKGPRAQITDIIPARGQAAAKRPAAPVAAPKAAAVADADAACDDEGCGEPVDYFTNKGKGFCVNHGPKAEL